MKISQVLQQNKQILAKISNTPQIDAEVLLRFVLKKSKEFLYTYPEYELTKKETKAYSDCIKKRLKNIPVAYITGFKEFYGREFIVTADTLIPRPETEMMVNLVTHNSQLITQDTTIVDVGTGSGCVIVSLAKELKNDSKFKIQNSKFVGIDISKKALEVAKKNAKKHEVSNVIEFHHGNLLEPILESQIMSSQILSSKILSSRTNVRDHFKSDNRSNFKESHHSAFAPLKMTKNIIITANLPYLTPEQIKNAPSIHKEPELALVAGDDGLKYYKELFKQINKMLRITSYELRVLCEIDNSQKDAIINLAKKELPNFSAEIKKDLAGLFRMLILKN